MSIEPKRLAAGFFVPHHTEKRASLKQLLEIAGASDISLTPSSFSDHSGLADCHWAGFSCKAYLDKMSYHQLLEIYFWQSDFLKLLPEAQDDSSNISNLDKTSILFQSFKETCQEVDAEAAFIVTHLDQAKHDWISSKEWMVLAKEANRLADEHFGLLYLNSDLSQYLTHYPPSRDRESLLTESGMFIFSGKGSFRWF